MWHPTAKNFQIDLRRAPYQSLPRLEAGPNDANILGNYADFLHQTLGREVADALEE